MVHKTKAAIHKHKYKPTDQQNKTYPQKVIFDIAQQYFFASKRDGGGYVKKTLILIIFTPIYSQCQMVICFAFGLMLDAE
jgi:hypothetical protein